MTAIPRCMSTQHPDNATVPFFATSGVLAGEDEIREAFYAYSHLGCDEQMWDVEGKEIGEALRFTDFDGPFMTDSLRASLDRAGYSYTEDKDHLDLVRRVRSSLEEGDTAQLPDLVSRAAILRRFLG